MNIVKWNLKINITWQKITSQSKNIKSITIAITAT